MRIALLGLLLLQCSSAPTREPRGSRVLRVDIPRACTVVVEAEGVTSVWIIEP